RPSSAAPFWLFLLCRRDGEAEYDRVRGMVAENNVPAVRRQGGSGERPVHGSRAERAAASGLELPSPFGLAGLQIPEGDIRAGTESDQVGPIFGEMQTLDPLRHLKQFLRLRGFGSQVPDSDLVVQVAGGQLVTVGAESHSFEAAPRLNFLIFFELFFGDVPAHYLGSVKRSVPFLLEEDGQEALSIRGKLIVIDRALELPRGAFKL